jgi:hypothetical protein
VQGGSLHDCRGNKIAHYVLGLGKVSNNLAKTYSLWCGLIMARKNGINNLFVFGDSMLVMKAMMTQSSTGGIKLQDIIVESNRSCLSLTRLNSFTLEGYWTVKWMCGKILSHRLNSRSLWKMGIIIKPQSPNF